jgi:hypothetical protein
MGERTACAIQIKKDGSLHVDVHNAYLRQKGNECTITRLQTDLYICHFECGNEFKGFLLIDKHAGIVGGISTGRKYTVRSWRTEEFLDMFDREGSSLETIIGSDETVDAY